MAINDICETLFADWLFYFLFFLKHASLIAAPAPSPVDERSPAPCSTQFAGSPSSQEPVMRDLHDWAD